MSDRDSSMNDLQLFFFLTSDVTTIATGGLRDVHAGGSVAIFWFRIFPPFRITNYFEASLLGMFLHSAMSIVEVGFVFLVSL